MITLHVIVDFCPDERLDRALLYLTRTHQTSVCIAGGAQLDRAMQFAERVRTAMPNIVIQFRILEDTGIIIQLEPVAWFKRYVTPRLEWLLKNKIMLVVDNETSGDDNVIKIYVDRSITISGMLHGVGLTGAYCRFSTGNIAESQYTLLLPLLRVLRPDDTVSPNEYSNVPPKSSGGHLERYKRIEAVAGKQLNISIGECGVLVDYKARAGYRNAMSGHDMAAQLISEEIWYRGGSIPRHLYCIGGNSDWSSLQIGDDALEFLESYYAAHPIQQPAPPIVVIPPVVVPPVTPPDTSKILVSRVVLEALRDSLQSEINVVNQLLK